MMPLQRPYVILNAAMSLDGKIATRAQESRLSSQRDLRRVHEIRSRVDGIMVGLRTLLADDPKLRVKYFQDNRPARIIVDSKARTPLNSYVVKTASTALTIIAVTTKAPSRRVKLLEKAGVKILVCGNGALVSLPVLMKRLRKLGIQRLLLEGGGILNWGMLSEKLVDQVSVAVSPRVLGGERAITLVEGEGVSKIEDAIQLRLLRVRRYGDELVLNYRVLG
jgi:2,5-diamino-6-(ribosylamino)-4(3H)-pyrimidinone 5'-phosphate reductase